MRTFKGGKNREGLGCERPTKKLRTFSRETGAAGECPLKEKSHSQDTGLLTTCLREKPVKSLWKKLVMMMGVGGRIQLRGDHGEAPVVHPKKKKLLGLSSQKKTHT